MKLTAVAEDVGFLEGPRLDQQGRLYFCDHDTGCVMRRNPDGWIETLARDRQHIGGLILNQPSGLVITGPSVALWDEADGRVRDLFRPPAPAGLTIMFNDLTADDAGRVYVGSLHFTDLATLALVPGNLYRINNDATVTLLWEGIQATNGIGFSPDGKLLYHADSLDAVYVYDVKPDGSVANRRFFAGTPEGFPDGLAIDAKGGVWVAVWDGGEAIRFRPDATIDQRVKVPARKVTSVVFGGATMQDMYIVTADSTAGPDRRGGIYHVKSDIPGLPVPDARIAV
jgi:xylono-1,5-lactonase